MSLTANLTSTPATLASLWDSYRCPPSVYDEVFDEAGKVRPHWQAFRDGLQAFAPDELAHRTADAARLLRDDGVTFDVFRELNEPQRPWRLDLIPLILGSAEWTGLQQGINQRAQLLEAIIKDMYGPQRFIKQGWLPPEVIYAHPGFHRPFVDLHGHQSRSLILYAAELARAADGVWRVMADRSEAPVGAGFALENRIVTSRSIPQLMHGQAVQRLAPFFLRLQNTLKGLTPRRSENSRVVLLSSGPGTPYYFEDVYLSGYLGFMLVQGSDLAVRDERLFLKTLAGLLPVDVVLCRGRERGIDPLELGGGAPHGVPGLSQVIRSGNVGIANVPGCGLVEAPVFMAFLPRLCRELLGEDLRLPSIPTWWCGDPQSLQFVRDHLRELVIKPAFEPSGGEEVFGEQLSEREQSELLNRIAAKPYAFVAQETVARSAVPVFTAEAGLESGHAAVRAYAVADGTSYSLMPGGLIRVAPGPEPMELSVAAGTGSKDLWVLADGPVEPVTLLQAQDVPVPLRRTGAVFPSRVADDLFWLGWSIERVDFLGRLVRSLIERLTAEPEAGSPEWTALIRALADQGQLEPGFAVEELSAQLPALTELLPQTLFETEEIRGLGHAVAEMLRLGSLVRDRLSPETWLKLHQTGSQFLMNGGLPRADLTDVLVRLNDLILNLASVSGLIDDGMIRGPAWRFLDMGRRIERGRDTAALLRTLVASGEIRRRPVMRILLEVLDCRMTYRSRYLDNLQSNAILDLFITDETNPRSVAFQAARVAEHVDALPHDAASPLRSEEKRLAMAVLHSLRMLTPEQLAATDLADVEQLLQEADRQLRGLTDAVMFKYLVHSGVPRQITDEVEATE